MRQLTQISPFEALLQFILNLSQIIQLRSEYRRNGNGWCLTPHLNIDCNLSPIYLIIYGVSECLGASAS
jgi:hypothetical protein